MIDGTVFDSSIERNEPATFQVGGVIKGWTEALQLMNVGSKWQLVIPADLAYGECGAGGVIGPNETLIFEVELLSIQGVRQSNSQAGGRSQKRTADQRSMVNRTLRRNPVPSFFDRMTDPRTVNSGILYFLRNSSLSSMRSCK